jgi:dTDP-4-dehydrorhamnose reductase
MDSSLDPCRPELWGGMECTINRVGNIYRDQLFETGHYSRGDDIDLISGLNIKGFRYPVLWEHYQPTLNTRIDWKLASTELSRLKELNVNPIVGLLHHGSGPAYTDLLDNRFAEKFSKYAESVAKQFPWVEYYTPVNEPLTTARFSGLYGLWYPHHRDPLSFIRMLMNQLKGVVLAMRAIRQINPNAKLVQTEDLSKTHSTSAIKYQADFENQRRWLSYDLLCGKVGTDHPLWNYLTSIGVPIRDLEFFLDNPCDPDVLGLNYYVTSERFLDERCDLYPNLVPGSNEIHQYVDTEAYRTGNACGLNVLLEEAWQRYTLPIAVTEAHLACSREEQMRWFKEIWESSQKAKSNGVPVIAVTAWALFGAYDWSSLLTEKAGHYESGAFIADPFVRPTALSKMISAIGETGEYDHPLLVNGGWWHGKAMRSIDILTKPQRPLLIIGKNGALATGFSKMCTERGIFHICLSRNEIDLTNLPNVLKVIDEHRPWGIVNTSGYPSVDDAEDRPAEFYSLTARGPELVAKVCQTKGIPFMTFSSDQVFDGEKRAPYYEDDEVSPLNHYGWTQALAEKLTFAAYPCTLIVRSSVFFGPWDDFNFAHQVQTALKDNTELEVANDVVISPTYIPHLVQAALDLFIDEETGIWHLCNDGGNLSWSEFAHEISRGAGYQHQGLLIDKPKDDMNWKARRPSYSVLQSGKGAQLPTLDAAIRDYFKQINTVRYYVRK